MSAGQESRAPDPAPGLHVATIAHEGLLWDAYLEFDDDPPFDPTIEIVKGQKLPNVAEFQGSGWASYTWPVDFMRGGDMFLRGQYSYTGDSVNLLIPDGSSAYPSLTQASYAIGSVRFGPTPNGG